MAIILDGTNEVLEIVTDGTEAIDVVVTYADHTSSAFTPGSQETLVTTATTTTVASSPAASTQRIIERVHITNTSATSSNVIVQKDVAATDYEFFTADLASDESLVYDGQTWQVITPVAVSPSFKAYKSAAQAIATGTWTKVSLDAEAWDVGGYFDSTTNYRYTPLVAGKYQVSVTGTIAVDDTEYMYSAIYKNGVIHASQFLYLPLSGTAAPNVSVLVDMNGTTDYLEFWVNHNQGANQNIATGEANTWMTAVRVSP